MLERIRTGSRNFLRLLVIASFAATQARAQDQQFVVVTLEDSVSITVDPVVLQEANTLRLPETLVPPTPGFELIGLNSESPALLVQRSAMGSGWYELGIEAQVLGALLELHGLAPDQRSRMLRWERDEVRAGCYRRLLEIINKPNRTPAEQRVFDATAAALKALHVQATEESLRLYNAWNFAPHLFVPPPPYTYDRPPPGNFGLFHLLGGPKPPSFDEFKAYGVAVVFAGAGGNGELPRITTTTATRSAILGGAMVGSGVVGASAGAALAAALPTTIATSVIRLLTPFATRAIAQTAAYAGAAAASSAAALGASVVGAVVGVIVTSVFEGLAVTEAAQVPVKLQEAVTNARNMNVNLTPFLATEAGLAQIYTTYLKTTLPDFPATEQAPPALASDQQWLTAPAGTTFFKPVPALEMKDWGGSKISVRLLEGWFVVRDQMGKETMTLNLAYQGTEGQPQTLTKLANGFFCTAATGNLSECAKVSGFSFRNSENQPRLAKLGSGGAQAVINPGTLNDGQVGVPFSQSLSVTSPAAGPYTFSHVTDGPALPPGLTLSSAGIVSGTPAVGGTFVFDVHATHAAGTHPALQRLTVRINGDPVPAPANLQNSWQFEDNVLDSTATAHGVWGGTAAYTAGWVGKAASFGGSNWIALPDNIFPLGAKTFETWFRTTGAGVILGQWGVNQGNVPAIYVDTNGKLRVSLFWYGTITPTATAAAVNNGQWHHVAVTHDGSTQRVYLDGALSSAVNFAQVHYDVGYHYGLGFGVTTLWANANNGFFTGDLDEPAIYGRALSAAEVQALYVAGGAGKLTLTLGSLGTTGAVGVHRSEAVSVQKNGAAVSGLRSLRMVSGSLPHGLSVNEAAAALAGTPRSIGTFTFRLRATDSTGHSGERTYTMTITGPWRPRPDGLLDWWPGEGNLSDRIPPARPLVWERESEALTYAPGLVGQAFSNLTYAIMPQVSNFGFAGFTWELWFQTKGEGVIMGRTSGGTLMPVLWVGRDGFVRADFSVPSNPALSKPITGNVRVDDGGWHHVALSYGGGEQRLHVDGVMAGVGRGLPNNIPGGTYTLGGMEPISPGWPGLPDGSNLTFYLPISKIDEPALFGRVLETSEINGIFASGSRGKPALLVNETTLPAVAFGIPYRQALTAQGATGAVTWSIANGSLPEGLRLSSSGVISGMLARPRSTSLTIQVTDSTGAVGLRDYVIATVGTPAPLPFGAVAWWRGDLNPNDSWGFRHGVPTFFGPTYRTGIGGHAFLFNREGSSLALPAGSFPAIDTFSGSRTPYSFETWFMTDRPGVILGRRDLPYFLAPFFFKPALYVGTDGLLHAPMFEVERTQTAPTSGQRVDDGKFHHAAVTYDGNTLRLYLDGVPQGPVITNATSRFGSLVDTVELGTGFTGGPWPATTGGWMSFYGYIDEPATYSRALSEAEIRAISQAGEIGKAQPLNVNVTLPAGRVDVSYLEDAYNGPEAIVVFGGGEMPPGLRITTEGIVTGIPESAGLYQFQCGMRQSNGTWLTFQYSLTIAGVAASPVGMAGWYSGEGNTSGHLPGETAVSPNGVNYALGQVGQAFSFDGVSQHLVVTNVPFPAPGGVWSFETWFRTSAGGVILGQNDGGGGYVPMLYVGSEGQLCCEPYWSNATTLLMSPGRVDDGIFHHAIFTYANGERKLYLDGELIGTRSAPGVPYAAVYNYQLGTGTVAGWPFAPSNRFFTGQIDEPQFYNRALRPAEARRGFTAGKLGRSAIVMDNTLTDITAATGPYAAQITATGGRSIHLRRHGRPHPHGPFSFAAGAAHRTHHPRVRDL